MDAVDSDTAMTDIHDIPLYTWTCVLLFLSHLRCTSTQLAQKGVTNDA